MSEYAVTFARSARKELEHFSADVVNRVFSKIELWPKAPVHPAVVNSKALRTSGVFMLGITVWFTRYLTTS
jgi:mRNA-degrading endonuclease RelE of RelBE toxin-antitoxin system